MQITEQAKISVVLLREAVCTPDTEMGFNASNSALGNPENILFKSEKDKQVRCIYFYSLWNSFCTSHYTL